MLAARGWGAVLAPMLTIQPCAATFPEPAGVQALLVASGNAIPAIPEGYRGVPLLAVGDATAARARARGFQQVHSANGDAADLAALAVRLCDQAGGPLLLVAGDGHGMALAAALRAHGFRVLRRVGYASTPVARLPEPARAALLGGSVSAALFFSGAAARAFAAVAADAAPATGGVVALAIGRAAGVALTALPWRSIRVAARPTADEMLALLP